MNRSLRLAAIRIARCYRTVSTVAALALAGLPPGNLQVPERLSIRRFRTADTSRHPTSFIREIRETTLQKWQARRIAETEVAGWTRRVLPSVMRWVNRPPEAPITFHLAQALTGHGVFNQYLHRFGIIATPGCTHCGAPVNDVNHTLFACSQRRDVHTITSTVLGRPVRAEDFDPLLCGDGTDLDAWSSRRRCFLDMIENILDQKKQGERERQRSSSIAEAPQNFRKITNLYLKSVVFTGTIANNII